MIHLAPFLALHSRLRGVHWFQRLTLLSRTLLILGFVSPGLTKVVGKPFATGIDPATQVGGFFEAFLHSGSYYTFVGWAQVAAAALLLFRGTALLGAVVFFPIILNIAVLTSAVPFGPGTAILTALMTLACTWLLVWDAHRLAPLVSRRITRLPTPPPTPPIYDLLTVSSASASAGWVQRLGYGIGFVALFLLMLAIRGHVPRGIIQPAVIAVPVAVVTTVIGWVLAFVAWRRQNRQPPLGLSQHMFEIE